MKIQKMKTLPTLEFAFITESFVQPIYRPIELCQWLSFELENWAYSIILLLNYLTY
jgi:hypothetical protein